MSNAVMLVVLGLLAMIAFVVVKSTQSQYEFYSPPAVRRYAGLVALVAGVLGAMAAYNAMHNEIHGTAIYYKTRGRGSHGEPVTRAEAPEKYRQATNLLWGTSIVCLAIGAGGFYFFRRLEE